MKLLIDESIPRRLKNYFIGHESTTVPERGWAGKSNGELIALARGEFDVFVTVDQNLEYQQNLSQADIALVVLEAQTNRIEDLRPLVDKVLLALTNIERGAIVRIRDAS